MPILTAQHQDKSENSHDSSGETQNVVHGLVVLPFVFEVAVQNNLEHANQSPAEPHQPAMDAHHALLGVVPCATTRLTVELDVEEAVVVLVEVHETIVAGQKRIHHLDVRIQWNIVVGSLV